MANINVKKRIENIRAELEAVAKHVKLYSGIPKKDAAGIGRDAEAIAELAVKISNDSDQVMGGGTPKYDYHY